MNLRQRLLFLLLAAFALFLLAGAAQATTPVATPDSSAQAYATSVASTNAQASTGSATGMGGSSMSLVQPTDNSTTTVGGNRVMVLPSVVPSTPASALSAPGLLQTTSTCGPLQVVKRATVNGTFVGLVSDSAVDLGETQELAPYIDELGQQVDYRKHELPNGQGVQLFGHQVITTTAVIGVSGARNLALGGGGSSGWGQAGGGASGAMQRLVTTYTLRECEAGIMKYRADPAPAPVVAPAPRVVVRTVVKRVAVPVAVPVLPVRIDPACGCTR